MLNVHSGLIIWTIITFVLLVLVLSKVAWKPLLRALHDRENSIREALRHADEARKEAEKVLAENRQAIAKANEETARLLREGRELAEQMKNEIVARAHESAKHTVEQAKDEIQREKEAALLQLRHQVADLAILAAEKILEESLDAARQKKIVDKVLQKLPKN
ncbi:MAG: F0F1 ATP synthase subunit B [Ignavibacteriales bacterium]|nr:F0F1 ATP synthase subunit B [Ignavibacteriales bacterium]